MISIRRNVFETNSSSTHSITMCMKEDYDKFLKGELIYHRWNSKFVSKEEYEKEIQKNKV